jgi:hypothetical protein
MAAPALPRLTGANFDLALINPAVHEYGDADLPPLRHGATEAGTA